MHFPDKQERMGQVIRQAMGILWHREHDFSYNRGNSVAKADSLRYCERLLGRRIHLA
jgi:hypothetical protein